MTICEMVIDLIRVLGVAFLTAASTILGVVLTNRYSLKRLQLEQSEQRSQTLRADKEKAYTDLLESLLKWKAGSGDAALLSAQFELVKLLGSTRVVKELLALQNYLTSPRVENKQDELYANLIKAMREDLGETNDSDFPKEMPLVEFVDTRVPVC